MSDFFAKIWWEILAFFFLKNVILEQCKGVHRADLGESFQTHLYLQNLVSKQPSTSPLKFGTSLAVAGAAVRLPARGHWDPGQLGAQAVLFFLEFSGFMTPATPGPNPQPQLSILRNHC